MTDFDRIQYERPDYGRLEQEKEQAITAIRNAETYEQAEAVLLEFQKKFEHCETMTAVAVIRGYLDGTDEEKSREMAYCIGQSECFDGSAVCEALFDGPFRNRFEEKYGTFLPESIRRQGTLHTAGEEYIRREQELLAECHQYISNLKFEYQGELLSASRIGALQASEDDAAAKAAYYAKAKGMAEQGGPVGEYLDRLVKVRNELARANGFSNYLEYCNVDKERFAYGEKELAEFCANVRKHILPLVAKMNEKTRQRLHLDRYTSEDTGKYFPDGNAKPLRDEAFVREKAREMFENMDPRFGEIYRGMNEHGYINIGMSDTKVTGIGFTTQVYDQRTPFIFGNFLGDADSVSVFLHECGHALQHRLSMEKYGLTKLYEQVQDLSELPSKSMELFSYEYAPLFFGGDAEKYITGHLSEFLLEIADYCMFHEFETFLYTQPEATVQERIDRFNELLEAYHPGVEYVHRDLMARGSMLYSNATIFRFVRYVISYSLSDLSALYLAAEFRKDKARGAALFRKLGEVGGSMDYHGAIAWMGLKPAYSEEVVREAAAYLRDKLGLD